MRRSFLYTGAAILVICALAVVALTVSRSKRHTEQPASTSEVISYKQKQACNIFTLSDAKKLLGVTAKGGASGTEASSNDLGTSTCSYAADAGNNTPVTSNLSASLLVRYPKTNDGANSNVNQFSLRKPSGVDDIDGYGDAAYWDPQYGQINILKNQTWYIVSFGSLSPSSRNLEQTRQLADLLIHKM